MSAPRGVERPALAAKCPIATAATASAWVLLIPESFNRFDAEGVSRSSCCMALSCSLYQKTLADKSIVTKLTVRQKIAEVFC